MVIKGPSVAAHSGQWELFSISGYDYEVFRPIAQALGKEPRHLLQRGVQIGDDGQRWSWLDQLSEIRRSSGDFMDSRSCWLQGHGEIECLVFHIASSSCLVFVTQRICETAWPFAAISSVDGKR